MQTNLNKASLKILTNHWGQKASPTWREVTTYLPPPGNNLFSSLRSAVGLYVIRLGFDCVVLGAGRSDFFFAMMQSVLPSKRVACIMIDCLWYRDSNALRHIFNKVTRKIINKTVDRFVVWASREIDAYAHIFSIPREKFVFVPYHTTVGSLNISPVEGNYIFSGGNFGRDYDTLIEAVRGLKVKVCIGCTRPELFSHISLPENVDVRGYSSHRDFLEKMAGCKINVVSLDTNLLHSGGQQTFLNSMRLGKPTIVNDPDGAVDYIKHGEDGLLVPPKNPVALREAITILLNDPEKAREMGVKALEKSKNYTTEEHFKKIVSIVCEVVQK
jgi:glycosyltransferase involved in cell wall biosynthesis